MKLLLTLLLLTSFTPATAPTATRPIQDQGSAPYCLFAVNAYLVNADMWRLAAEYQRRDLPTWDGLVPYNENVLALATELHGGVAHVAAQWDSNAVRDTVRAGIPVAVSGQGHALVLIRWSSAGRITYLDSLHADAPRQMTDRAFWDWWDSWAWWIINE